MKHFKNLHEAIQYHERCPFCAGKMVTDMDVTYDDNSHKAYLKFGASKVIVDCVTNDIIQYSEQSSVNTTYSIGCGKPAIQSWGASQGLSTTGIDYRRVSISCDDCYKYGYLIQVIISLKDAKILGLFLNSESVSIEDGARLYEIKNIYATEKTEMSTFHQHLSKQRGALDKVEFPLVPLDLQDPMKTVERIKNLLAFL